MKLQEIYELSIRMGMENDLRGIAAAKQQLKESQAEFNKLSTEQKILADQDALKNPYPDSRICVGDPQQQIKRVLAGIDMGSAEVLLADRLGNIDLIIAHHPEGKAITNLHQQMHLQSEILASVGVPINIAEGIMRERIDQIERRIHGMNYNRNIDTAKALGISYVCAHTVCDNMAATFVKKQLEKAKPQRLSQIMGMFMDIPEYKQAALDGAGPKIFSGSANNRCGKVVVTEFTGGTDGSKMMYERLSHAGVGTIISMHVGEEHRTEAQKHHLNIVVAGHMSSDSLGMNIFLDQLEKSGIEIVAASGLIRVSRLAKTAQRVSARHLTAPRSKATQRRKIKR